MTSRYARNDLVALVAAEIYGAKLIAYSGPACFTIEDCVEQAERLVDTVRKRAAEKKMGGPEPVIIKKPRPVGEE